mgnify:FL=1
MSWKDEIKKDKMQALEDRMFSIQNRLPNFTETMDEESFERFVIALEKLFDEHSSFPEQGKY